MTHPPIPPNCRFFFNKHPTGGDRWYFDSDFTICLHFFDDPDGVATLDGAREIVAAVAEVAWIREADRSSAVGREHLTAIRNAEAWRKWGEQT